VFVPKNMCNPLACDPGVELTLGVDLFCFNCTVSFLKVSGMFYVNTNFPML